MSHNGYIKKLFITTFAVLALSVVMATAAYARTYDTAGSFVTTANVNLRSGPSADYARLALVPDGTVVTVTNFVYGGFSAVYFNGTRGYASSEWIRPHVPADAVANAEPLNLFVATANVNLRSGPSADYARLALVPVGTTISVYNFVYGGFSFVSHNGRYGYVSSEWIRPHVAGDPALGTQVNSNVELLHWRYVRQIVPQNSTIHILDVRTGLTYYVRNWSNGNHADVDPLTATDTETLRATYGGRWSWDPRPVIATVNGRSFAAAINGMPHGGSMTPNNGVNGHFCLHFYGSTTHNGNRSYEREMQAAVMQAFNSAR